MLALSTSADVIFTYTLHAGAVAADYRFVHIVERAAKKVKMTVGRDVNLRLAIDPTLDKHVSFTPKMWSEVRVKSWKTVDCQVPVNETLFVWEGSFAESISNDGSGWAI